MTQQELDVIYKYYFSLCDEIENATLYVEPKNQEKVYSIEFAKILFLSCIELESVFKTLCFEISSVNRRTITGYSADVLGEFPNIDKAEVIISRTGTVIKPFDGWTTTRSPSWWTSYNNVKHNLSGNISSANYKNAIEALSALHISLLYLAKKCNLKISLRSDNYIDDNYSPQFLMVTPPSSLP